MKIIIKNLKDFYVCIFSPSIICKQYSGNWIYISLVNIAIFSFMFSLSFFGDIKFGTLLCAVLCFFLINYIAVNLNFLIAKRYFEIDRSNIRVIYGLASIPITIWMTIYSFSLVSKSTFLGLAWIPIAWGLAYLFIAIKSKTVKYLLAKAILSTLITFVISILLFVIYLILEKNKLNESINKSSKGIKDEEGFEFT